VVRDGERALAWAVGEAPSRSSRGAPGIRWPGCWNAPSTYGRLRNGLYGLTATLVTSAFLALLHKPWAEGAIRVPPGALGRCWASEVKTTRRKLGDPTLLPDLRAIVGQDDA
jgi:hypothetical protein